MIVKCPDCLCSYNDENAPICPICNEDSYNNLRRGSKRRRGDKRFADIGIFKRDLFNEIKKTSSGHWHKKGKL